MVLALEEVAAGMSIRQAARVFDVHRNTLGDRIRGRVTHGCRTGPTQILSPADERSLVQYCVYCTSIGYPLTKVRFLAYAHAVRRKRSPNNIAPPLGQKWWLGAMRRHLAELTPDVDYRQMYIFGQKRTVASSAIGFGGYSLWTPDSRECGYSVRIQCVRLHDRAIRNRGSPGSDKLESVCTWP